MIYVNFCVIFTMYRVNAFVASSKVCVSSIRKILLILPFLCGLVCEFILYASHALNAVTQVR